ncbi:MAG: nucleotide pyrophosphohydrolase [Gemmatimonadetes bacterium]|nr:nucleotide pyrophosphohydrolase [Gemmatimonadota bacterium]
MLPDDTKRAVLAFRDDRDWKQFHSPRNLAVAISVEAGELLEQFQWMTEGEQRPASGQRDALEHEVADLVILLTYFAHDLGIDVDQAVRDKLRLNGERYPVARAKGSARKYNAP